MFMQYYYRTDKRQEQILSCQIKTKKMFGLIEGLLYSLMTWLRFLHSTCCQATAVHVSDP